MPRETMTIRLEGSMRRRLASAARRSGRTTSAVVRAAIERWLTAHEGPEGGVSPYDAIADLVGCVHGGDPRRSTRGARRTAADLRARHRARRR